MKNLILFLFATIVSIFVFGQNAGQYVFSTSTGGVAINPTYTTVQATSTSCDDGGVGVTNIGFNFVYEGTTYTQFSANHNGVLKLGGTAIGTALSGLTANGPIVAMGFNDISAGWTSTSTAANAGYIRYGVSGTSPNRIFVADFFIRNTLACTSAKNTNFQVRLYETSNKIEILFISTSAATTNTWSTATTTIGIGGASSTNYLSVNGSNTASNSTVAITPNWPGNGRMYTFTPPIPTITSFTPSSVCASSSATVVITGTNLTGASSVTIGGTAAASYVVNSATQITATIGAGTTGTISVTTTGGTATSASSLTVNTVPGAVTVATAGTYCTSTTLTASGGSGGTIYWQGTTSAGTSTTTASSSQSVSASGTYYFRAQSGGCWGTQGSAAITINTPISITTQPVTTPQTKCSGSAFSSISVVVTGTSPSYQWQQSADGSTGWINAVGGTGSTTATYTPPNTTPGVLYYRCVITSGAPCSSSVTSGVSGAFTINSSPTISYTGSPFTYLVGTAITTLTPSITNSPTSFSIGTTLPGGLSFNTSNGQISGTPSVTSASTAYTITGTAANGCTGTANINIAVGPANGLCSGAIALSCGSSSGTTIGTTGVASGIPTAATYLSTGLSSYGVWYTVVGDGSTYSITFTPSASYDPEVDVVSGSCGTYTAVTAVDAGSSGGSETVTFATTAGTNYYIYIAHYASGNTTTGTFTISTTITPARPTGITGPNVVCSGSTGTYSVTNVSGNTYNWTLPSGWTGTSTSNSIVVTPGSSAGMIYVSATNSCGSTSSTANISASVNTYPQSVSAGPDVTINAGDSQQLTASATTGSVTLYNNDCNRGTNWATNDINRWGFTATSNAGGVANEIDFYYYVNATVDAYIRNATLIDATNFTGVTFSFRHSLSWFSGSGPVISLETSPDNVTWTSRWSLSPNASIAYPGGAAVNVDLSALNGTSFYFRFRFNGNTAKMYDWFIDNIAITANATLSYSWINTTTGLSATNISNPLATPTETTTYTVQANAGGCLKTANVTVTVNGGLPIELISFDGVNKGSDNYLFWITASEHNTSHFNLQKSRDGQEWTTITTLSAAGNSNINIDYDVVDYNVENIINYYRLQQYDNNGVYETFGPIAINNIDSPTAKTIVKYVNLIGQEIDPQILEFMSVYIEVYSDGTIRKIMK